MKESFLLFRILQSPLGASMIHPVKAFERESDAKDAMATAIAAYEEIMKGTIMVKVGGAPKAVMGVGQFLADLGIAGYGHNILRQEIHGSLILAPVPRIIS